MSRPHALVLAPRLPWPLDDGGHIATWQSLWAISREYDTTLVALVPEADAARPLPGAFAEIGVDVVRVGHRPPWTPLALARGTFGRWPYMLARYRNATLDATLRRMVAARRPVLVMANKLHMTTYFDALAGVPAMLRAHDLEHEWLERYADRLTNPLVRAYARAQARRTVQAERELYARCRLVLPVQEREADAIRALAPGTRVEALPIGVDLSRYRPRAPESPPLVTLMGSWDWAPNADGGRLFLERSWPRVRAVAPQARLRVVGKKLPVALADAARRAGGEPVGYVEDMTLEFARAAVMPVPLWMGSGIRVKIIEALAAGAPIVSTPLGAEGLELEHGVHALFAETPEAIGDAVGALVNDPERARRMSEAGRELARRTLSQEAIGERMLAACRAALEERRTA